MRRLFPHPYLTLTLTGMWFLLVNEWKLGSLVMALILGTILPLVTSAWWPDRPRTESGPRPDAASAARDSADSEQGHLALGRGVDSGRRSDCGRHRRRVAVRVLLRVIFARTA